LTLSELKYIKPISHWSWLPVPDRSGFCGHASTSGSRELLLKKRDQQPYFRTRYLCGHGWGYTKGYNTRVQ